MSSELLILIGALGGALIGAVIAPILNHIYSMKRLRNEFILKEKIESFKKIYKITCEIKIRMVSFLIDAGASENSVGELFSELNNEFFLFSDKNTLKEVKEKIKSLQDLLDDPPRIVRIENKKMKIDQKKLRGVTEHIGNMNAGIIQSIRKELKIK
ncbi:MAG: hypothetical protein ABIA78_00480 [archaeon]